jgi:transcriptional regulator with XRE-family HTH domain
MATFGKKLRQLREDAGMTQEALARKIDMSLSIVRDYEQGRKGPSAVSLFKLADALGVSCEVFKDCIDAGQAEAAPAKKTRKRKGE